MMRSLLLLAVLINFLQAVEGAVGVTTRHAPATTRQQAPQLLELVKGEIVDAVDGYLLAESGEERIDHTLWLMDRHKASFSLLAGTWILRSKFLSTKIATNAAATTINQMRAVEAAKWGTRKVAGL